jgi:crotonobetainyl-CoA:carnitine CoA-transferase CaiB-like acyl-CoA transferase
MRWVEAEGGVVPGDLRGRDWRNWIAEAASGDLSVETLCRALDVVAAFLETKTKAEIQAFANDAGAILSPVFTIPDLLGDPQLAARGYWTNVGGRTHPGPFARLSATPLVLERPAPALGANQGLLYEATAPDAGSHHGSGDRRPSFDGLRVADFAWVGVGPMISKAIADHGATVVHLESANHVDVLRLLPPFKDATPGLNRSLFMANFNTSKLGLAADLGTPEGRELAMRLVDWADVVVESFTPGTMARHGPTTRR